MGGRLEEPSGNTSRKPGSGNPWGANFSPEPCRGDRAGEVRSFRQISLIWPVWGGILDGAKNI